MKVIFEKNWNGQDGHNRTNHESSYSQEQVARLIGQVRNLEGIKDQNYTGVPTIIKVFAEGSLWSDSRVIYVVKGIHQRWNRNDPHPHIRVRTSHTFGPSCQVMWVDFHIELSEEYTALPSQHVNAWGDDKACCWQAVGISYIPYGPDGKIKKNTPIQRWPAQFTQSVDWIQDNTGNEGPSGRIRRLSVGCRPAPMAFLYKTET